MSLSAGTRLGPYEIVTAIGSGGMGEVYRARDTRLNRDVAIKVLPDALAQDTDRLARFTREAQTLAALNHPNIAAIYGLEDRALVMELVPGQDLSEIIAAGRQAVSTTSHPSAPTPHPSSPLPLEDVISIARQIADALEAAHEQGIVHRDLKPANVKVRADGSVKVLDFGLAKAMDSQAAAGGVNPSNSPTLTAHATQLGMIIGTAAYMSPEQARGRVVDRRADIWAFGAVLYEMLTGRRAFEGDDVSDILASVLKTEPAWSVLPPDTPASLQRLLRRCLEKDPRRRLGSIGDARLELEDALAPDRVLPISETAVPRPARDAAPITTARRISWISRLWPAAAAAILTAGIAAWFWPRSAPAGTGDLARFSMLAPAGASLYPDSTGVAISPDGNTIAFIVGTVIRSETQLWVRSIGALEPRRLEAGDGAQLPFWSPDGRRLGFFTKDKLKTVSLAGGRADTLCDTPNGRGAVWLTSNVIVFAPDATGPLYRISPSGGKAETLTTLDPARKEYGHRFPSALPDGEHFTYAALPGKNGQFDIFAGSLKDSSRTFIGSMESAPVYADPGWLLYARQGVLTALPFDTKALKITGDPIALDDAPTSILDPATSYTAGRPVYVSPSGSLVYFSSPSSNTTPVWIDASGLVTGALSVPPGHYESAAISPDGTHAVLVQSASPSESSLWLIDLARGGASPLSTGRGRNDSPVWSPDSTRIVFSSDRDGAQNFFVKNVSDGSPEQPFFQSDVLFKNPVSWSSDGRWVAFTELDPGAAQNIWLLPMTGEKTPKPFVRGPARDIALKISPDDRWLAYISDDTGRTQLYAQSFPEPGRRIQLSQQGAAQAWWSRDGRQIVFADAQMETLWRVDIEPGAALSAGTAKQIATLPPNVVSMSATPDRQKFLAIVPERAGPGSITIVRNWRAALSR